MTDAKRGYKEIRTMQYTEIWYYAADGTLLGDERKYDDMMYDVNYAGEMTEQEMEDWA